MLVKPKIAGLKLAVKLDKLAKSNLLVGFSVKMTTKGITKPIMMQSQRVHETNINRGISQDRETQIDRESKLVRGV